MNMSVEAGQAGLVSIVIPSYNHAQYLHDCVESALNQTYRDIELVIVDDGSSDATREWLKKFDGHERVRVYLQDNAGAHAAINRGISLARGEYIGILNSDDVYLPTRIERLMEAARGHQQPCLLFSTVVAVDEAGKPHPRNFGWNEMVAEMIERWHDDPDRIDILAFGNLTISTSNFFFRRDLVDLVGMFRNYRFVHDWEFVLRTARLGRQFWSFVEEPLLHYRLHGRNTILTGVEKNHAEAIHIVRQELHFRAPHLSLALRREQYLTNYLRKYGNRRRDAETHAVAEQLSEQTRRYTEQRRRSVELLRVGRQFRTNLLHSRSEIERLDSRLVQLDENLQQLDRQARHHEAEAEHWRTQSQQLQAVLDETRRSRSWRVTAPLRRLSTEWARGRRVTHRIFNARARHGGWSPMARAAWRIFREQGWPGLRARLAGAAYTGAANGVAGSQANAHDGYQAWVASQEQYIGWLSSARESLMARLAQRPVFSVVVPVYNPPEALLREMLDSVRAQLYPDWELCIADDGSDQPHVRDVLMAYSAKEPRLRIEWRPINAHICEATNSALALARGDYVVLLDHDDLLAPHALLSLALWIDAHPEADVIYSDEDKIDAAHKRSLPLFKPDWSPALLSIQNYIGHALCVRRTLALDAGGFRVGFEGSQDYDLALRLARLARSISHLPDVLYHWRMHEGSTSSNSEAKPYAHEAGKRALEEHLMARYGSQYARVADGANLFTYDPRFQLPVGFKVSIIIPTRNRADLLQACIRSILARSTFQNYEIVILDNQSDEVQTIEYLRDAPRTDERIKVVRADFPFNCPFLNNYALDHCDGDILVFLNNDTVVISPDWLERLSEWAFLPDVATVGPMLLYEDGTLQHAGVVVGMGGWADHVFKGQRPEHRPTPFVSSVTSRNVLAVTGACMAIERSKFENMGRFDESFEVCGSDVEIGIRAHKQGLQNVYLATVRLYHLESKTRDPKAVPEVDFVQSALKYAPYRTDGDPFFNPNLSNASPAPIPLSRGWQGLAQPAPTHLRPDEQMSAQKR